MPIYTFHLPIATDPTRIDAWLAAHGYTVIDGSSVHSDGSVSVNTDRDPSADFAAYADAPTQQQQQVAAAVAYLKSVYVPLVQAIPAANRTPEQKALLSIVAILKATLTP